MILHNDVLFQVLLFATFLISFYLYILIECMTQFLAKRELMPVEFRRLVCPPKGVPLSLQRLTADGYLDTELYSSAGTKVE